MLLDEDPATLIHETTHNFNTAPDQSSLSRIAASLSTLRDSHVLRLSAAQTTLKRNQRHLLTLQAQHNLTVSSHDPAQHAANILALDTHKFKVAKEASDLEIEAERLEGELGSAEGILREVEAQGVEGSLSSVGAGTKGRHARDGLATEEMQLLKLKLYRSLGIDVEGDTTKGSKGWSRAIVRNEDTGKASIVDFEGGEADSGARRIWDAM